MHSDIQQLLDYLWNDEERHWEESGHPSEHIFMVMRRVREEDG